MKNSNLKKALAKLSMDNELEIINPETIKGGAAGCTTKGNCGTKGCGTRRICIIKLRDVKVPVDTIRP